MTIVLPNSVKNSRKKVRTLAPVKPSRGEALGYYNQLNSLNKDMLKTSDTILKLISMGVEAEVLVNVLMEEHRTQQQKYTGLSPVIASNYVLSVRDSNKRRVEATVSAAFGLNRSPVYKTANADSPDPFETVSLVPISTSFRPFAINSVNILDDPLIANIVQASTLENAQLIRSIVPEYFSKIAQAVAANFRGEEQVGGVSLVERLEEIGGITENRARFIARDQTAKLTSTLTRARHEAVGIKRYKWRTDKDERVVGNPAGKYPKGNKGHGNHWVREGVVYAYDKPPSDGNPGHAYNCRCTAEAILDLDDMDVVFGS